MRDPGTGGKACTDSIYSRAVPRLNFAWRRRFLGRHLTVTVQEKFQTSLSREMLAMFRYLFNSGGSASARTKFLDEAPSRGIVHGTGRAIRPNFRSNSCLK